jgi:hypothetical protein
VKKPLRQEETGDKTGRKSGVAVNIFKAHGKPPGSELFTLREALRHKQR